MNYGERCSIYIEIKYLQEKNLYNQRTHHFISSKIKKQTSMYRSHCFSLKTCFIVHLKFMQETLCQRVLRNFKLDTSNSAGKDFKTAFYIYYKKYNFQKFFKYSWAFSPSPFFFFPKHFTHFHQLI